MNTKILKDIVVNFNYIIIYYVILINLIYLVQLIIAAASLGDYIRKIRYSDYKKYMTSENMIPISILVPAYNEEETIVENIKSLISLNYPKFEVIVINDGSKDNTLNKIINEFDLKKINQPVRYKLHTKKIKAVYRNIDIPNLILVDKENGGKADALNAGINVSNYPIIASIDADSILESDSLVRVVMPFIENKSTIAVGGIVRVANGSIIRNGKLIEIELPKSRVAMFQIVEYLRAFLTGRVAWDAINSLLIVSGAFGAFKKEAVIEVGGYAKDTIGEDMELVVKLHEHFLRNRRNYRIKFIPDPVCWTQAPETLRDLRSQRRRWQIGLMQSLIRYRYMMLNPKYRQIGLIAFPYFFFFEMFGPIIETIGYILIPIAYIFGLLNKRYFLLFLIASILYGVLLSLGAILLEEYTFNKYPKLGQLLKLSFYGILENFGYRQLTTLYRIDGLINYKRKKRSWGNIKRYAYNENA